MGVGVVVEGGDGNGRPFGGEVGEGRVLGQAVHDIDAEAVDAAIEPEAGRVVHGGDHVRVAPVEVGLLGQEQVQVPLAGGVVPGPGVTAEGGLPVVRRPV